MWWLWGLLDDVETFLVGLFQRGEYARRQRKRLPVPEVRNMPFDRAWETLVLAGFDVKVTRLERQPAPVMGLVVAQYPPAGRTPRRNSRVRVTVHHPPDLTREQARPLDENDARRRARTAVPDVRGLAFSEAWERLTLADFAVRVDRSRGDPRPVIGPVIGQDPPPGILAPRRMRIRLTVGPGTPHG